MTEQPDPNVPRIAPDDASPEPATNAPAPLLGRAALQAAIEQAAAGRGLRKPQQKATPGKEGPPTDEQLQQLTANEAFRKTLEWRKSWYQQRVADPTLTLDQIRVMQGALLEIEWWIKTAERLETLQTPKPEPLPANPDYASWIAP